MKEEEVEFEPLWKRPIKNLFAMFMIVIVMITAGVLGGFVAVGYHTALRACGYE